MSALYSYLAIAKPEKLKKIMKLKKIWGGIWGKPLVKTPPLNKGGILSLAPIQRISANITYLLYPLGVNSEYEKCILLI